MTRSRTFILAALILLALPHAARADEAQRPDDLVIFDLSAEDWVTTKTARVNVGVEAAVTANTAGTIRADMTKAVNELVKADWRLTSFNRSQDETGLERWSASFEARVPENNLGGLGENAKKASKAGMQITVNDIDFSPTLDETQAAYGVLRAQIYKAANDQLATLNTALPGRNYRIATINFTGDNTGTQPQPMPMVMRGYAKGTAAPMMAMANGSAEAAPMERAEKVTIAARVTLATLPPVAASSTTPAPAPAR